MALGFFRRRQKMVIIIMVVLMLSFLLGGYGVSTLMQTDPNKRVMAESRYGDLTRGSLLAAEGDIEVMQQLGMGRNIQRAQNWPLEMAFLHLLQSGSEHDRVVSYALLLQEADAAGVVVTSHDVDTFFVDLYKQSGNTYDETSYKGLISSLRAGREGWTERGIRAGVASWLKIYKYYTDVSMQGCAPSSTDLKVAFRDVTEEIDLRVVRLKAADYLKDVPEPNQQAIAEQFKTYQTSFPDQNTGPEQYGFGYRQPGRAEIDYLLVRGDAIARVTKPAFNSLVDYYNENKNEFYREVPIDANASTTSPADANTPTRRVPLTFAEAKQQIIDRLMDATVRTRIDELASLAQKNVSTQITRGEDANSAYKAVVKQMTRPAGDILDRDLTGLKIESMTVEDAIGKLASAANIPGICFPWGTHGKYTLDKDVKVTLTGDMKLRKALEQICLQVKLPLLAWACCDTFGETLFSVSSAGQGIDFFPLKTDRTDPMSYQKFVKDPVFGACYASPSGQGQSLAQAAFSAPELSPGKKQAITVNVGQEGTPMYLVGEYPGRLLWRLTAAMPAHVPVDMSTNIQKKVVDDLKLIAAMKLAEKKATTIRDAAEKLGLEVTADRMGLKTFTTGLFTRKRPDITMDWNRVPNIEEIDTRALSAYFMPRAFGLAPKNVDANAQAGPPAVGTVQIPELREVFVLQRIGYKPALKSEYDSYGKILAAQALVSQRQYAIRSYWFNCQLIQRRTKYQPATS